MQRFIMIATLLAVTGCVSLPQVDPDLACDVPTQNETAALHVMERENLLLTGIPFVAGNKVDLLENGPATYAAMQTAILHATTRIDLESYGFEGDVAAKFAALLLQKRAQGLQVDLIYDAWGSMNTPESLFDSLRAGGVAVEEYHPLSPGPMTLLDFNSRDHRKLLVIDGETVFTGGINISQVYENPRRNDLVSDDPEKLHWRDTDVEIIGPAAADFQALFMESWRAAAITPIPIPAPPATPPTIRGGERVEAVDGTPPSQHPAIYRSILTAIAAARGSVHLTSGFFAPTPDLVEALQCAAHRGVDVEIIVPSRSTSDSAVQAGRSHYEALLQAGVKIYERQGSVLHAKTAVIDGVWSVVGSANLDWRSVVFNNEIDAVILGPYFGKQMEIMFAQDRAASQQITLQAWQQRGIGERLDEFRARAVEFML